MNKILIVGSLALNLILAVKLVSITDTVNVKVEEAQQQTERFENLRKIFLRKIDYAKGNPLEYSISKQAVTIHDMVKQIYGGKSPEQLRAELEIKF